MPVITTFGGMSARGFGLFSGGSLQLATSFITITAGTTTNTVPLGYNAVHIQAAVGGGGGAMCGADYDKAGGESAGAGGGSGAYISDKIFTVIAGETLTFVAGSGGAPLNGNPQKLNGAASPGTDTTLSGSTTGSIFSLTGGGGSSGTGGGGQGPIRTNTAGTAGVTTISGTALTSGKYNNSGVVVSITTNTSGPVGTFNQSGNGAVGNISGSNNCGGDNCQIGGSSGASSYAGNISGGAGSPIGQNVNGTAGTRGSGGGGGGAQYGNQGFGACTSGAAGGNGEIIFRFLQVKQ
jgi:hypothetical protein